jgi:hypothetical protein
MSRGESMTLGVVLEHRRIERGWQSDSWRVAGLLPPDVGPLPEPWTLIDEGEGWRWLYAGSVELELFPTETASYRDNLASSRPAVYVVLRRDDAHGLALREATVDPGEIEAHADAGDDLIEAAPLPAFVAAWMQDFVARHHVERPFHKRQRDRVDPEALARRPTALGREGRHG